MSKKILIFSLVAIGLLLLPHFSFAADILNNTSLVTTSTNFNMENDTYTAASFEIHTSLAAATGTVVYYAYYAGTGIDYSGVSDWFAYDTNTGSRIELVFPTSTNSLIIGSDTLSNAIHSGDEIDMQSAHSTEFNSQTVLGEVTASNGDPCGLNGSTCYYSPWFYLGTTPYTPPVPPSYPPSVNFVFPTSSVSTYPYLNNIIYNFGNLTSTDEYSVNVQSQVRYGNGLLGPLITDPAYQETGAQFNSYGLAASAPVLSAPTVSNEVDSVSTTVYLYDITGFQVPDNLSNFLVASSSLVWNESNTDFVGGGAVLSVLPDFYNTSGTGISYIIAATNTLSIYTNNSSTNSGFVQNCLPASSTFFIGQDIFYAGCSLVNLLFVPPSSTFTGLSSAFQSIENTPLLSGFFLGTTQIQTLIGQGTTPEGWVMPTITSIGATTTLITLVPGTSEAVGYVNTVQLDGNTFANSLFNLILDAGVLGFLYLSFVGVSWFIRIISK